MHTRVFRGSNDTDDNNDRNSIDTDSNHDSGGDPPSTARTMHNANSNFGPSRGGQTNLPGRHVTPWDRNSTRMSGRTSRSRDRDGVGASKGGVSTPESPLRPLVPSSTSSFDTNNRNTQRWVRPVPPREEFRPYDGHQQRPLPDKGQSPTSSASLSPISTQEQPVRVRGTYPNSSRTDARERHTGDDNSSRKHPQAQYATASSREPAFFPRASSHHRLLPHPLAKHQKNRSGVPDNSAGSTLSLDQRTAPPMSSGQGSTANSAHKGAPRAADTRSGSAPPYNSRQSMASLPPLMLPPSAARSEPMGTLAAYSSDEDGSRRSRTRCNPSRRRTASSSSSYSILTQKRHASDHYRKQPRNSIGRFASYKNKDGSSHGSASHSGVCTPKAVPVQSSTSRVPTKPSNTTRPYPYVARGVDNTRRQLALPAPQQDPVERARAQVVGARAQAAARAAAAFAAQAAFATQQARLAVLAKQKEHHGSQMQPYHGPEGATTLSHAMHAHAIARYGQTPPPSAPHRTTTATPLGTPNMAPTRTSSARSRTASSQRSRCAGDSVANVPMGGMHHSQHATGAPHHVERALVGQQHNPAAPSPRVRPAPHNAAAPSHNGAAPPQYSAACPPRYNVALTPQSATIRPQPLTLALPHNASELQHHSRGVSPLALSHGTHTARDTSSHDARQAAQVHCSTEARRGAQGREGLPPRHEGQPLLQDASASHTMTRDLRPVGETIGYIVHSDTSRGTAANGTTIEVQKASDKTVAVPNTRPALNEVAMNVPANKPNTKRRGRRRASTDLPSDPSSAQTDDMSDKAKPHGRLIRRTKFREVFSDDEEEEEQEWDIVVRSLEQDKSDLHCTALVLYNPEKKLDPTVESVSSGSDVESVTLDHPALALANRPWWQNEDGSFREPTMADMTMEDLEDAWNTLEMPTSLFTDPVCDENRLGLLVEYISPTTPPLIKAVTGRIEFWIEQGLMSGCEILSINKQAITGREQMRALLHTRPLTMEFSNPAIGDVREEFNAADILQAIMDKNPGNLLAIVPFKPDVKTGTEHNAQKGHRPRSRSTGAQRSSRRKSVPQTLAIEGGCAPRESVEVYSSDSSVSGERSPPQRKKARKAVEPSSASNGKHEDRAPHQESGNPGSSSDTRDPRTLQLACIPRCMIGHCHAVAVAASRDTKATRCLRHGGGVQCCVKNPRCRNKMMGYVTKADNFGPIGPRCIKHNGQLQCVVKNCKAECLGRPVMTWDQWGHPGSRCLAHGGGHACNVSVCLLRGLNRVNRKDHMGGAGWRCDEHKGAATEESTKAPSSTQTTTLSARRPHRRRVHNTKQSSSPARQSSNVTSLPPAKRQRVELPASSSVVPTQHASALAAVAAGAPRPRPRAQSSTSRASTLKRRHSDSALAPSSPKETTQPDNDGASTSQKHPPPSFDATEERCNVENCSLPGASLVPAADSHGPQGMRCMQHSNVIRCTMTGCHRSVTTAPSTSTAQPSPLPPRCHIHASSKLFCSIPGCPKVSSSRVMETDQYGPQGRRCTGHGGGKRCNVPTCTHLKQGTVHCADDLGEPGWRCIRHNGGKHCVVRDCTHLMRGKVYEADEFGEPGYRCVAHGGGRRCGVTRCRNMAAGWVELELGSKVARCKVHSTLHEEKELKPFPRPLPQRRKTQSTKGLVPERDAAVGAETAASERTTAKASTLPTPPKAPRKRVSAKRKPKNED
eukprot:GEMP01000431.1.p1 GENE.GEMP01000431.1~~GEMP01000431.1.p1  ORF type:complete len:1715 (+),score=411.33 GEMP01000431.1:42-5147(+)